MSRGAAPSVVAGRRGRPSRPELDRPGFPDNHRDGPQPPARALPEREPASFTPWPNGQGALSLAYFGRSRLKDDIIKAVPRARRPETMVVGSGTGAKLGPSPKYSASQVQVDGLFTLGMDVMENHPPPDHPRLQSIPS